MRTSTNGEITVAFKNTFISKSYRNIFTHDPIKTSKADGNHFSKYSFLI